MIPGKYYLKEVIQPEYLNQQRIKVKVRNLNFYLKKLKEQFKKQRETKNMKLIKIQLM